MSARRKRVRGETQKFLDQGIRAVQQGIRTPEEWGAFALLEETNTERARKGAKIARAFLMNGIDIDVKTMARILDLQVTEEELAEMSADFCTYNDRQEFLNSIEQRQRQQGGILEGKDIAKISKTIRERAKTPPGQGTLFGDPVHGTTIIEITLDPSQASKLRRDALLQGIAVPSSPTVLRLPAAS